MSTFFLKNTSHFDYQLLKAGSQILRRNVQPYIRYMNGLILFFSSSHVGRKLNGLDHAARIGDTLTGNVEGGAVVGGGADDGQAEGDVDPPPTGVHFQRDETLVVIHGHHRIKFT